MAFQRFVVLVFTKSFQHSHDGDKARKRALLPEIFVVVLKFFSKMLSIVVCCLLSVTTQAAQALNVILFFSFLSERSG